MLRRYMIMKKLNNILIDIHIIWTVLALRLLHYMIKKNKKWESATDSQKKSIEKLVDIIKNIYELEDRDVYEHDKISYKTEGEGADLYSVN